MKTFNTSLQSPYKSSFCCCVSLYNVTSENSFSQIAGLNFPPSHSSNPRVGVCACNRLGGSGVRCHPCLRGGFRHHLWMRQPPQGSAGRGMEVGRLQRGCGVWNHGLPGVRWREGEPTRLALGYEPPQQWGRKNGGFLLTVLGLFLFEIDCVLTYLIFLIYPQSLNDNMFLKCKCHGLSGSCEVKTCWWSQPDFRVIGNYMKDKYDSASEMVVEKHRESRGWVETLRPKYNYFKPPTERDLVYYETSPNFCDPNPQTGSFGTRDRVCNLTSHGIDGCDLLCCGRGHNTRTERRKEKCHCIFHWCCYVSCQECVRVYDVHTCK